MFRFVALACLALAAAQSPSDRAKAMLAKMTLDEKITMVHGSNGAYVVRSRCRSLLGDLADSSSFSRMGWFDATFFLFVFYVKGGLERPAETAPLCGLPWLVGSGCRPPKL
jgi:hypothetical protein